MGKSPSVPPGTEQERATGLSVALKLLSAGPVVILIALLVILTLTVPNFFSPRNISNILAQIAVIAVVALGQHLVILTRGIDLSVGANLALATVLGALMFRVTGNPFIVMGTMLLAGAVVGAVNGLVYVYGRLPHPFIITLATLSIARGLALELSIGHTTMRGMPEMITTLGEGPASGFRTHFSWFFPSPRSSSSWLATWYGGAGSMRWVANQTLHGAWASRSIRSSSPRI
ncbi:ABC transporter permease (plasmid) [Rhizobium sp. 32-5/1]|nr:ABC transporter permease [Rhizobium sp. 32-5/1]WEZ85936.1 ABC transporter permease [Rhizobium sp. 32-5/1]